MMKKLFLLCSMLLYASISFAIDFTVNGLSYEIKSDTEAWVVENESYKDERYNLKTITIPETVTTTLEGVAGTYTVTGIGLAAFYDCDKLETITIPASVATIFDSAFMNCTALKSIDLSGVTKIGLNAFAGCTSLTSVAFGENLASIGTQAFSGCPLTEIKCDTLIPATAEISSFSNYNAILTVPEDAVASYFQDEVWSKFNIANGLSYNITTETTVEVISNIKYESYKYVTIPQSVEIDGATYTVTSIGENAFKGCSNLISINLPSTITTIASTSFRGCIDLEVIIISDANAVYDSRDNSNAIIETQTNTLIYGCKNTVIPTSVEVIGDSAFADCTSLTTIEIPLSITTIASNAFAGCTSLKNVIWNPATFADFATQTSPFYGNSTITSFTLGELVEYIPAYLFEGMTALTSLEIPNSVTSIATNAFTGFASLTSIIWNPTTFTDFATQTSPFYGNSTITSFTFGESVEYIPTNIFEGMTALTSIIWNPTTFANFSSSTVNPLYSIRANITSFTFGDSVTTIPAYLCYEMTQLQEITIPENVTTIHKTAFSGCTGLTSIIWNPIAFADFSSSNVNPFYSIRDNITSFIFGNNVTTIPAFLCCSCTALRSVEIPNSCVAIGESAFNGCIYLGKVELGNITTIGRLAFQGCTYIKNIVIPNSVISIGVSAFGGCSGLTTLKIGDSVVTIGNEAFYGCEALKGTLEIPNSVKTIGNQAFYKCPKIEQLILGNSVTSIGNDAFYNCVALQGLLTLPSSLEYMSVSAFGLTKYTVYRTMIKEPSFPLSKSYNLPTTLIVPKGSLELYQNMDGWKDVATIIEEDGNNVEITNDTPGGLLAAIVTQCNKTPALVTGLTVHGTLNDDDISGINTVMTSLLKLDISDTDYLKLKANAFKDKSLLLSVQLPNNLTEIGVSAFENCSILGNKVVIPSSVTIIRDSAFKNCNEIFEVELPENLTSIGSYAFYRAFSLRKIVVPESVATIGLYAFQYCSNLISAEIRSGASTYIRKYAFANCTALQNVSITSMNIYIDSNAFENCSSLTALVLPKTNGSTVINSSAFRNCSTLADFVFPTSLTTIGANAFENCSSLNILDLSECESLTSIPDYAFSGCTNIETINFPSSLASVGTNAFKNCTSLLEMSIPRDTPPTISDTAKPFENVDNLSCVLSFPSGKLVEYVSANYWGSFVSLEQKENIKVEISNENDVDVENPDNGDGTKHHQGCHIHFHKGQHKGSTPQKLPGIRRAAAEESTSTYTANGVTYSGSSVMVEGEECVTFVIDVQEGYEIAQVLYGGEDVTSQLVGNTFTTPAAEANTIKTFQVILAGGPEYALGDVNADEIVNVADVIMLANYILGTVSEKFVVGVADINGDSSYTVADVVALVNLILGITPTTEMPAAEAPATDSSLAIKVGERDADNLQTIAVELNNDLAFSAFQADVKLPAGMKLVGASLSDRASANHSLKFVDLGDGVYRLLSYSSSNKCYADQSGNLFTLVVNSTDMQYAGRIEMSEIEFSTADAVAYKLDDVVAEVSVPSSVDKVITETRIYAQNNVIIIESPVDGVAQITSVDGKSWTVDVLSGVNEYEIAEGGVYVVKFDETTEKVFIK